MSTIVIGGDICPKGIFEEVFCRGDIERFTDLYHIFNKADYSVVNLECPFIEKESPIGKDGIILGVRVQAINGLKALGINAVNLANNHILDHDANGLSSTLSALRNSGIHSFGAGMNLQLSREPLFDVIGDKRFCFIGIAEHEFSIANENSAGANPLDVIQLVRTLRKYEGTYDHLIVLIHGGKEYYRYPSPKQQELCRFIVELGADAVICQHSHCVGAYEYYLNKPILYGQGNLCFENKDGKYQNMWNEGCLVSLDFANEFPRVEFIPFKQIPEKGILSLMKGQEKNEFLDNFEERSKKILCSKHVKKIWVEQCRKEKYLYLSRILGHNKYLRVLNRTLHFSDWLYSKKLKFMIRNVIECETHREGLLTIMREEYKK